MRRALLEATGSGARKEIRLLSGVSSSSMAEQMKKRLRGVLPRPDGRFEAVARTRDGKQRYLGRWATERDAALAVDRFVLHERRQQLLHFPHRSRSLGPASAEELLRLARVASRRIFCASRYEGISWQSRLRRWEAGLVVAGCRKIIGHFDDERDAAIARDRFALHVFRRNAPRNLPSERLRPATFRELRNWARLLKNRDESSRFEGVVPNLGGRAHPWRANIKVRGRPCALGSWPTEREAAIAYDRAALWYRGAKAILNFPEEANERRPADAVTLRAESTARRKSDTTSRFIGVYWNRRWKRWVVGVKANGIVHRLGPFENEQEAALERDRLALALGSDDLMMNFHPDTGEELHGTRLRDIRRRGTRRRRL